MLYIVRVPFQIEDILLLPTKSNNTRILYQPVASNVSVPDFDRLDLLFRFMVLATIDFSLSKYELLYIQEVDK
ncbi:hypothetical protein HanLR1_Chr11g0414101 [Helianthus annuus]|nr:hypothetical protein HanHA89_Chr11g0436441 [Helianthus annuus]KAJ0686383.1 hypothetical protein HanLR1_Chr11g0414101 [Helianthus annuus]